MTDGVSEMIADEKAELAQLKLLALLDASGFLLRKGESEEDFRKRVAVLKAWRDEFLKKLKKEKSVEFAPKLFIQDKMRIPPAWFSSCAEECWRLYQFRIDWVSGFFLTEPLGLLWGGCSWCDPESGEAIFIIRPAFKKRERWFIYDRTELMAHELCHIAHAPVSGNELEEFFAYQTARSGLRRYMGNCFVYWYDALLFLIPSLLLLVVQILISFLGLEIPLWPFWFATFAGPGWLAMRNQKSRNFYFKAERNLLSAGITHTKPVLFRLTVAEIRELAAMRSDAVLNWFDSKDELRFKIIKYRFIDGEDKL